MSGNSNKNRSLLICLTLIVATFVVFYQVHSFKFVNFDDAEYTYKNLNIQAGITLKAIRWAFTTSHIANWHPLTWLSHMLDWQLFGPNPAGHHLVSLIFHIANTLLLFVVLKQMTSAIWPSVFVAALFALHPLHVESVAWVSERKDVLSTFFWLLTMWAYVRFVRYPKIANYLLVVVFLAFGLMSKPMLVTLPFVLLLLDYWPLDRLGPKRGKAGTKYSLSHLIIEKVPLFVMVLVSCIVTYIVQRKAGAMHTTENYNLLIRFANVFISYLQYINKTIWPVRLAMFYPHPGPNVSFSFAVVSAALLLAVTILILRFAKDRRYLVTGWFWYLGTLVPVIGLVQVGSQAMADRYSYITLTGLFIIIAWGLPELFGGWPYRKVVLWISSLVVLFSLAVCSHFQQRHWKNTITLCEHALKVTDDNYMAHFCITDMLLEQGRIEEAVWHSAEAVRIRPNRIAVNGLGIALYRAGRIDDAIRCYKRVIEVAPGFGPAHANLGYALAAKGKFAEAVGHYRIALETVNEPRIHSELGDALLNLGRFKEAVTEYRKVLSANSNDPNVLNALGYALMNNGELEEAIAHFNQAVRIDPNYTTAKNNLNIAIAERQKLQSTENTKK